MRRVFSTAMPVVLAGEVRQSKRRRRAAVDREDFSQVRYVRRFALAHGNLPSQYPDDVLRCRHASLSSGPCSSAPSKKRGFVDFRNNRPNGTDHPETGGTASVYAGLARLFRLLRNARGADCSHSLGPLATAGCLLAPMENTTASASGTHRAGSLGAIAQHGRQRPWTLASRPEQSPLRGTLQCLLQIARSPVLDQSGLA